MLQEADREARLMAMVKTVEVLSKPHRISLEDREQLLRLRNILGMTTSGQDAEEFLQQWADYRAKYITMVKAVDEDFFVLEVCAVVCKCHV